MSKLKADVRPPKHIDRDGQLDLLRPAGTVVVVQHQRVVLISTGLTRTSRDVTLKRGDTYECIVNRPHPTNMAIKRGRQGSHVCLCVFESRVIFDSIFYPRLRLCRKPQRQTVTTLHQKWAKHWRGFALIWVSKCLNEETWKKQTKNLNIGFSPVNHHVYIYASIISI